jgi:calcineurin-like phosphoesterase family protein
MSSVWFTADSHFGHRAMAATGKGWRPFATIEEHDETLIENWNKVVKADDQVWHLGDVGMGPQNFVLETVKRLNGHKHLIAGNHDKVWSGNRDGFKHMGYWMQYFDSVQSFARRRLDGNQNIMLSHFPYATTCIETEPGAPEILDDVWRETEYSGYHVNAQGQVRGRFGRVLSPWAAGGSAGNSYLYVAISGVGNRTVHSLVCTAFHGPRPDGMQVAHSDGNNMNNKAGNVRWATPIENRADQVQHGTQARVGPRGATNSHAVLTEPLVAEIRASEGSTAELATLYGVSTSTIRDILKWRTWKEAPRRYPLHGDHTGETRYTQYRLRDDGLWLAHGHVHTEWAKRGRQVNVGVDVRNWTPMHLDQLVDAFRATTEQQKENA